MRILVTGSSGFIGTHLTQTLLKQGHSVVGLDIRPPVGQYHDGFRFHAVDILHRPSLIEIIREHKFDAIIHLAAGVGPEQVVADPYSTVQVNVEGTRNILAVATIQNIRHILFTSTSEVYGNSRDRPFSEDKTCPTLGPSHERRWCYAASKLAAEHLVLSQGGIVARIFNTTGPGQSEQYVLPRFIGMALRGEDITLYGDGTAVRCFCHVQDTVTGLIGLLDKGRSGQVYNIGFDQEITIKELAQTVKAVVNPDIRIVHGDGYKGSLAMPYRKPDLTKIRKETGWHPRLGLTAIIEDVVKWKLEGGSNGGK